MKKILILNSPKNYKLLFISCMSRFFPNANMYKLFKPIDELNERIEKITKNFSTNTIGVHIRRTDHQNSMVYGPNELFIKAMREEIEINPSANFFLHLIL